LFSLLWLWLESMARRGKALPSNDTHIWVAVAGMVMLNVILLFMTGFLDMAFSPRGALEKVFGIHAGTLAHANITASQLAVLKKAEARSLSAQEDVQSFEKIGVATTTVAPQLVGPGGPAVALDRSIAGRPMPLLGFGTCCRKAAKGEPLITSTLAYLKNGGRLIDTAFMYMNHKDIAQVIKQCGVPLGDLWITDKINPPFMGYDKSVKAIDQSLTELGIPVLDMMLIHLPFGDGLKNKPEEAKVARVGTWKAMVEARKAGKIRHIGVSNFDKTQIMDLVDSSGVWPANNQIEYGPWSPPDAHELVKWMQEQGIVVTGYGSLGHAGWTKDKLQAPALDALQSKYKKSASQILLRWALDNKVATVPGATSEAHIKENLDIADFRLTKEDIESINNMPKPSQWKWLHASPGKDR